MPRVTTADISPSAGVGGPVSPVRDDAGPTDQQRVIALREGLRLMLVEVTGAAEGALDAELPAGLSVHLCLGESSEATVSLGERVLPLGRHRLAPDRPTGLVTAQERPARLRWRLEQGGAVRMLAVTVSPAWLDATFAPEGYAFPPAARAHLAVSRWMPLHRLCLIAARLFDDDEAGRSVARLRAESVALHLVADALATLRPPAATAAIARNETVLMSRVKDLIESKLARAFTVAELAHEVGIGLASLQRLFQADCGMSVKVYVRARRLDVAHTMLEQRGLSVLAAAQLVGYGSAANFATAFRRRFGITPSQARRGS